MSARTKVVAADVAKIEAILARIKTAVTKEDHESLTSVVHTLIEERKRK